MKWVVLAVLLGILGCTIVANTNFRTVIVIQEV